MVSTKSNAVVFYLKTLLYVLLALLIRVVVFTPLAAPFVFKAPSVLRYLAFLSPILFFLLLLPLRFSFAEALMVDHRTESFRLADAFAFSHYGEKLGHSFFHAGKVLLWGIPTFGVLGYGLYLHYFGQNMALLQLFPKLGKFSLTVLYAIRNFFGKIFGAQPLVVPNNTMAEGLVTAMCILGFTLLIWLFGAVRNSPHRYLWVLSERNGTTYKKEKRSHLMGRRGAQFVNALINLLFCVPFLTVAIIVMKPVLKNFVNNLTMYLMSGRIPLSQLSVNMLPLVLSFFFLYLTVIPARRIRTCHFVTRPRKHHEP